MQPPPIDLIDERLIHSLANLLSKWCTETTQQLLPQNNVDLERNYAVGANKYMA